MPGALDPPVLKSWFEEGRVSVRWGLGYPVLLKATPHFRSCLGRKTGGKKKRARVGEGSKVTKIIIVD